MYFTNFKLYRCIKNKYFVITEREILAHLFKLTQTGVIVYVNTKITIHNRNGGTGGSMS